MQLKSPDKPRFWLLALLFFMLLAGVASFRGHVTQLRDEIENTMRSRSELLSKFVALHRDQVTVMHNLMLENYSLGSGGRSGDFKVRMHPQQGVWEGLAERTPASGMFTGSSPLPLNQGIRREMVAVLGMEAQIRAAQQLDQEVSWLYYLSAGGFIYLAPKTPFENFHFTPALYQRRYWLEAGPQANPQRRMVLAGPYQDLAGKGWLLTFAQPVYADDQFLGVVALDLQIDTLQHLTNVGAATGETMLISENDRLIARQSGFAADVRLRPPVSEKLIDWREDQGGDLWLSFPVVKDELWLVHRVKRSQLYGAAARESAAAWVMILLLGVLAVIAWRLRGALSEVIRLTQVDPLTQALNRRGFYDRLNLTLPLAKRNGAVVAVLIMDIDFFKKVNDTYGHAVGDSVLKQLGGYLLKACRPTDLVCRWGGEEFVLVLPLEHPDQALQVAERMRQEAQRTRIEPGDEPVTLSGGLVLMGERESMDEAIKRADLLLYQAKGDGRNRIVAQR